MMFIHPGQRKKPEDSGMMLKSGWFCHTSDVNLLKNMCPKWWFPPSYLYIVPYKKWIKIYQSNLSTRNPNPKHIPTKPGTLQVPPTYPTYHPFPVLELNDTSIQLGRTITFRFQAFNLRLTVLRRQPWAIRCEGMMGVLLSHVWGH